MYYKYWGIQDSYTKKTSKVSKAMWKDQVRKIKITSVFCRIG